MAINHKQSSKRFISLHEPIKKYIQEEQSKKTRTKTRREVRLACLANFSTEEKGKESSEEGKCALSIFDDNEFYQARKCLEARSNRLKKQGNGNKSNAAEAR